MSSRKRFPARIAPRDPLKRIVNNTSRRQAEDRKERLEQRRYAQNSHNRAERGQAITRSMRAAMNKYPPRVSERIQDLQTIANKKAKSTRSLSEKEIITLKKRVHAKLIDDVNNLPKKPPYIAYFKQSPERVREMESIGRSLVEKHFRFESKTIEGAIPLELTTTNDEMCEILALLHLDTLHDNKTRQGENEADNLLWVQQYYNELPASQKKESGQIRWKSNFIPFFHAMGLAMQDDQAHDIKDFTNLPRNEVRKRITTFVETNTKPVMVGKKEKYIGIKTDFEPEVLVHQQRKILRDESSKAVVAAFGWSDIHRFSSKCGMSIDMGGNLAQASVSKGKQLITLANLTDAGLSFLSQSQIDAHFKQNLDLTYRYRLSDMFQVNKNTWGKQCDRLVAAGIVKKEDLGSCIDVSPEKRLQFLQLQHTSDKFTTQWDLRPVSIRFTNEGKRKPWFTCDLYLQDVPEQILDKNTRENLTAQEILFKEGWGVAVISLFGDRYTMSVLSVSKSKNLLLKRTNRNSATPDYNFLTEALMGKFLGDFLQSSTCVGISQQIARQTPSGGIPEETIGMVTGDSMALAMYLLLSRIATNKRNDPSGKFVFAGIDGKNLCTIHTNQRLDRLFDFQ